MVEYLLVAVIVGAALAYIARYVWRMSRGKATGCGCGAEGGACPKQGASSASATRQDA